jgi:hypothetical protein
MHYASDRTWFIAVIIIIIIIVTMGWDCLYGTAADNGPIVHPKVDAWVNMEQRWNDIDRGKPKNSREKSLPVPLCPPQIPHWLPWARTTASAVKRQRLTVCAMARPKTWFKIVNLTGIYFTHIEFFVASLVTKKNAVRIETGDGVSRLAILISIREVPNNMVRFQVLTATSMKMAVFWDFAPCSLLDTDRSFRGTYCLHQGSTL